MSARDPIVKYEADPGNVSLLPVSKTPEKRHILRHFESANILTIFPATC